MGDDVLGVGDSLMRQNAINGKLSHSGNSYFWDGVLNYNISVNKFNVNLIDKFHSTLIKTNNKYIQDVHSFNFDLAGEIASPVKYIVKVNSILFSDDRSVGINNASVNSFLNGFETDILEPFVIRTLAGWRFDNQIGEKDKGFSYMLTSRLNNYNFSGYYTNLDSYLSTDYLDPRKNTDNRIYISIRKDFSGKSINFLRIEYHDFMKDFYVSMDPEILSFYNINSNIERRNEENFLVANDLSYNIFDQVSLSFNTNFYSRSISKKIKYKNPVLYLNNLFDQNINESKLDGSVQLRVDFDSYKHLFKIGIAEREEKRSLDFIQGNNQNVFQSKQKLEKSKDNTTRLTYLSMDNLLKISGKDEIRVSGMAQILRYDTPGEGNNDDRDELQYLLGISYDRVFNEYLYFRSILDLSNSHNVFLYSERSANNAYNKIIRFNSALYYNPSAFFRSSNIFEVMANYTIYDFEDLIPSVKSMVFRQFLWVDSSSISLSSKTKLDFYSYIKLFERGDLNWDEFKENPVEFLNDNTIGLNARYIFKPDFYFSFGYKMFFQYRYNYTGGERELSFTQKSYGPVFQIYGSYYSDFAFIANGWYETISNESKVLRKIVNLDINVRWYF